MGFISSLPSYPNSNPSQEEVQTLPLTLNQSTGSNLSQEPDYTQNSSDQRFQECLDDVYHIFHSSLINRLAAQQEQDLQRSLLLRTTPIPPKDPV